MSGWESSAARERNTGPDWTVYFSFILCITNSRLLQTIKLERVVCNSGQTKDLKTNVVANGPVNTNCLSQFPGSSVY